MIKFVFKAAVNNTNTPMLQCHGTEDPVIYYKWGLMLADLGKSLNPKYEFKTYDGLMHAVNDQVRVVLSTYYNIARTRAYV